MYNAPECICMKAAEKIYNKLQKPVNKYTIPDHIITNGEMNAQTGNIIGIIK